MSKYGQTWPVWVEECAFDRTTFAVDDNSGGNTNITYCNFNALVTNGTVLPNLGPNNLWLTSFNWQSSWYGSFYLMNTSPLINKGSTTADQLGLYHFTTQTNQVKEMNSVVDIGYHYVATDDNGNPSDTDVDGWPDYLEDANGNGVFDAGDPWNWQLPDVDTDGDGLLDCWELSNFGNLDQTATGDYDNDGINNGDEYANGTDPNDISFFSIESANDYVNTTDVSVQLNITAGTPGYYALFVDATTATNWIPFTGTNLTLKIGPTDGVYNVVVGLKGFRTNAIESWKSYSFILDRVAPGLTITNPALVNGRAVVIKPYLQLQGFADEPLSSLAYDISNSAGLSTNLDVRVTGQYYDTNLMDSTTTRFQAYDVPLAEGENAFTLRMADRAGNVTVTNFTVVLDYTTATNSPEVQLLWPQDGMAVSGSGITIRGRTTDETGGVEAEVVNGDGTTSQITGLVERNGIFWLENVPVSGDTHIRIKVTDGSGKNTTGKDIILHPSDVLLTIDSTPGGDDLYKPVGLVTGSVSDPDAIVTVNGQVAETYPYADGFGNYFWMAENVPNYGEGTVFYAASASYGDGNPVLAYAGLEVEKWPYIAVEDHLGSQTWTIDKTGYHAFCDYSKGYKSWLSNGVFYYNGNYHSSEEVTQNGVTTTGKADYNWRINDQGDEDRSVVSSITVSYPYSCEPTPSHYFDDADGSIRTIPYQDVVEIGNGGAYGTQTGSLPSLLYHYCSEPQRTQWTVGSGANMETYRLDLAQSHTFVKLYTGGKSSVTGRQSLFWLNCSAMENGRAQNPGWINTPLRKVDCNKLSVQGKKPDADGKLWMVFADNSEQYITLTAEGVKDYSARPIYNGDAQKTTIIDLDVDSDNKNGLEGSLFEDEIEELPPGKYLPVNNNDIDDDEIPDFADGYNLYGMPLDPYGSGVGQSDDFTPLALKIPYGVDPSKAKIRFSYSSSDPAAVTKTVKPDGTVIYTPAPGGLRIWIKNGVQYRKKVSVTRSTTG